jgi:hypothetical protein
MNKLSKPAVLSVLLLWSGAALMLGAVTARTLFDTSVLDDRELSGALVGAILRRFYLISYYALGFCALVSLLGWLADLKGRTRMRFLFVLSVLLLGANIIQDKVVRTEMVRLKLQITNSFNETQQSALRERFSRVHGWSMGLYGVCTLAGLLGAGTVLFLGEKGPSKGRG